MIPKKKLPRGIIVLVKEGWPFIILLFALAIEFAHIATSSWLNVFLYNGDSLTLPIIRQTLAHKEPFLWVSSSQFLLFPEGFLYAISSNIIRSVRGSLVLNGVINIFVLYALVRWMSGILLKTKIFTKQLFTLGACLLLVFYMLLERQPLINSSSVATLFLFTTYYYGVILSGAFLLCVMLLQSSSQFSFSKLNKWSWLLIFLSFVVALLTTFSDPIFIIQFLTPALIAVFLTVILNGLKPKNAILMAGPLLVGSVMGYVSRFWFKPFVGESLGNHIITQQIPSTLTVLRNAISYDLHSHAGFLELVLVLLVIAFSLWRSLWWIYQQAHNKLPLDGRYLLIGLFSVLVPICVVLFSIFTGSMVTRYLLPLFVFPLFGLFPLLNTSLNRFKPAGLIIISISAGVLLAVLLLGITSTGKANNVLSSTYPDSQCLSVALDNKPAIGVGEYWDARPLGVYANQKERVVQVNADLSPYLWQSNLGSYNHVDFSFIVIDKQMTTPRAITASDPHIPANPTKIFDCSDVSIYRYSPQSAGYKQLNRTIAEFYSRFVKIRASGNTAQLY